MSHTYSDWTVPQLRSEVKTRYESNLPTGLSKMRKAELIELLNNAPRVSKGPASPAIAEDGRYLSENEFLAAVGFALAAPMSEQDRHELDMAKYRGRYEGKRVRVVIGERYDKLMGKNVPNIVFGKVVSGTHRTDPLNRGEEKGTLVLAVRHEGLPRATMHRAEDVVLV